jgi:hypothetical protein
MELFQNKKRSGIFAIIVSIFVAGFKLSSSSKIISMNNIVLIGFMGSGKTSVAKVLSEKLKFNYLDTDSDIESEQKSSISDIILEKGEPYFRNLELECIKKCVNCHYFVISTGGGLPIYNGFSLKKLGKIVFLRVKIDTILERLKADDTRPLLKNGDKKERIQQLLKYRIPFYQSLADCIVDTDLLNPLAVSEEVIVSIKKIDPSFKLKIPD